MVVYKHLIAKSIIFSFIFFTVFLLDNNAQTADLNTENYRIEGRIIDENNQAIEYANIGLYNASADKLVSGAISQHDGTFVIDNLSQGNYKLKVLFVGFETYESPAYDLSKNTSTLKLEDIILKQLTTELGEVEVVGQRKPVVYKLDKKVIDAEAYSNAAGGTAVDVLENAPSITVDVQGNVMLRGNSNFTVYIDGKPSLFEGSTALEQIPAGQIDNIEIITNPSARYDAEGTSGIINIITKKQSNNGITGLINVGGSTVGSHNVDFLFTKKMDSWYWKLGGNENKHFRKSYFEQSKSTELDDTLSSFFSEGDWIGRYNDASATAGFGYFDDKTTFDFEVNGGVPGNGYDGDLLYSEKYLAYGEEEPYNSGMYNSRDYKDMTNKLVSGNTNFKRDLPGEGHEISANVYANYNYAMEYFQNELKTFSESQKDGQKSWEEEYRVTVRAKADYIKPIFDNEGKFEAGYLYDLYIEDGDYTMHDYDEGLGDYVNREDYYSKYRLKRDIHSIYSIISNGSGDLSYQLGIRGEYSYRTLGGSDDWAVNDVTRFDFFPSAHTALQLVKDNQISASYSRRIVRPRLHYLEPFVTFADSYTARTGNPFVRPEYVNSFELGWQKNIENADFISLEVFHRRKHDKIERIRTVYSPGITLDSISNVGNDYSTGAEAMANFGLFPWWTLNSSSSLYHYIVKSDYKVPGVDDKSLNWTLRFSNMLIINSTTKVQLDGNYVGPSVSTQGTREAFFYTNMSVRKQFFNRKLSASIVATDILKTARYRNTQTGIGMSTETEVTPYYPTITCSLSFKINQYNQKAKQEGYNDDLFEGSAH